jgi:hypothetical protein
MDLKSHRWLPSNYLPSVNQHVATRPAHVGARLTIRFISFGRSILFSPRSTFSRSFEWDQSASCVGAPSEQESSLFRDSSLHVVIVRTGCASSDQVCCLSKEAGKLRKRIVAHLSGTPSNRCLAHSHVLMGWRPEITQVSQDLGTFLLNIEVWSREVMRYKTRRPQSCFRTVLEFSATFYAVESEFSL